MKMSPGGWALSRFALVNAPHHRNPAADDLFHEEAIDGTESRHATVSCQSQQFVGYNLPDLLLVTVPS
jgi:hypothetical protein